MTPTESQIGNSHSSTRIESMALMAWRNARGTQGRVQYARPGTGGDQPVQIEPVRESAEYPLIYRLCPRHSTGDPPQVPQLSDCNRVY